MNTVNRIYIIFVFFVMLWCGGLFAAPLLKHFGFTTSSDELYSFFSHVCHQDHARSFHLGNEHFAVCIRCTAIYFSFLAGLFLIPLFRRLEQVSVPSPKLLLLILLPMVIDVVFHDSGIHASTTVSRMITGMLLGGALPWWVLPLSIEAWSQLISRKKIHSQESGVYSYVRKTQ